MAQNASAAPILNISTICNQLKLQLKQIYEKQASDTQPIEALIDQLVSNVRQVPPEYVSDILRFIFYPFGTYTLDHGSQVGQTLSLSELLGIFNTFVVRFHYCSFLPFAQTFAMKMVKLMHWWLIAKPSNTPGKALLELVRERRIIIVQVQPDRSLKAE